MIVLGIDPGSNVTGYGIIHSQNASSVDVIDFGCIRLSGRKEFSQRLKNIYDQIFALINKTDPDYVVFEDIFYSRNIKSALQLGQARGAAMIAALNCDKLVTSYSPREVKQALTGNGGASKEQVQRMVQSILGIEVKQVPLDATDALAIAFCHINRLWTKRQIEQARA